MDYRHLKYFMEVAQQKSFSKAARNLHISQSAISRMIKSLEEELGVLDAVVVARVREDALEARGPVTWDLAGAEHGAGRRARLARLACRGAAAAYRGSGAGHLSVQHHHT